MARPRKAKPEPLAPHPCSRGCGKTVAAEADNCGVPECAFLALAPEPPRYPYASLRLNSSAGGGARLGSLPGLVEASEGRTIEFRKEPYEHFAVLPMGIEIPLARVSQAIPANARASVKVSRAARLAERQARIDKKLANVKPKNASALADEIVDDDDTDFGPDVTEGGDDVES